MAKPQTLQMAKDNLFSRAAARTAELVYVAMQDKKLRKKEVPHTRIGGISARADVPPRYFSSAGNPR